MKHYTARMSAPLFGSKYDRASGPARLTESEWVSAWKTVVDGIIDAALIAIIMSAIALAIWYSGIFQ